MGEMPKEFRFKILDWIVFDEQLPLQDCFNVAHENAHIFFS